MNRHWAPEQQANNSAEAIWPPQLKLKHTEVLRKLIMAWQLRNTTLASPEKLQNTIL